MTTKTELTGRRGLPHGLVAQKPAHTPLVASEGRATKWSWPVSTMVWAVIGACIPINYALPSLARGAWFAAVGAAILIPILTLNISRPLYPAIWVFAGYATTVSVFLATTTRTTFSGNLFVGAQLILLLCFGPFVLTRLSLSDPKFSERVFIPYVAAQTLSSFVAFLQSAGYATVARRGRLADVDREWYGRYPGLAEHQTSLGLLAALAVLLSLQLLNRGGTYVRVLLAGAVCVNIVGILVSGSLSGVMALLTGLTVAALSSRNRRHFVNIFLGGFACVVTVWLLADLTGASKYLPSVATRYQQVTGQTRLGPGSVQQRVDTWERVLNTDVSDLIFGQGFGVAGASETTATRWVHNTVLRAWFQGGITLGIAFALISVGILLAVLRAIKRKECGTEAGVLAAVLSFTLVSPVLEQRHFWLPVLVAWGSISATAIRSRDRMETTGSGVPTKRKRERTAGLR